MIDIGREINGMVATSYTHQPGHLWAQPLLRSYPLPFGEQIAKMMPDLLTEGQKRLPLDNVAEETPKSIFSSMQFGGDTFESDLTPVIVYLRGSKKLRIPADWRGLVPLEL